MLEKPIQRRGSIRKECLYIMHASKCQLLLHWGSHFLQSPARRTPLSSLWAQRGICQSNGEHWIAWQSANQPLWTTFSATVSTCVLDHASFVKIFERRSVDSTYFKIFDLAQNLFFCDSLKRSLLFMKAIWTTSKLFSSSPLHFFEWCSSMIICDRHLNPIFLYNIYVYYLYILIVLDTLHLAPFRHM